ncbi:DUF3224 domain-containing protein [Streptomyces antarcticus]|uniref:DUF3224 domain-containing protein n=1 Tax=Streptomyces antarcticus TaxID=2996458 RepID=UPI00226E6CA0|nr:MULTISPECIES: DUF3224 domain-containing protein [unclassified Streptomyces]MCY0944839.1 DUF3224 domain-containing protein [Streptomyces sp. H34-AA3]MCY0954473.1 DUF3224 domain-containing protein [Streptomyces sp. H27-S2]MCZ4083399.1 DUF3224 domain-containing protein [Streptomyces sp. H34-S5]
MSTFTPDRARSPEPSTASVETSSVETAGRFTYAGWEELPVGSPDGAPRLARALVTNTFTGGVEASGTSCAYTIAYTGESVGSYTGMELLSGSVDGRRGSFVLEESGTFDAGGTTCRFAVVPGSGTGDLTGLSGSGGFTHRHGEASVAYAFSYRLG